MKWNLLLLCARKFKEDKAFFIRSYESQTGLLKFFAFIGCKVIILFLPLVVMLTINRSTTKNKQKPQLQNLSLFADNLPISWGKIVKTSAADYEDRINELWREKKYRSAKWNLKLAWICALSNLGHYIWLKAWKPVSTVFRRLL